MTKARTSTARGKRTEIVQRSTSRRIIGHKVFPNSARTFPNKRAAAIVDDAIEFHGARCNVTVHNTYRSRLFPGSTYETSIAADRIVRLQEDEIECWIDTHLAKLTLRKREDGERPPYGAFLSELPKRVLKRFPILVEYDTRGTLVAITIFRPGPCRRRSKGPRPAQPAKKRAASARAVRPNRR
jgi:hypothetical protein